MLARITTKLVEEYRDHRRQQPSIRYRGRTLKGATVNRELECLTCLLDLAVRREYIPENPARAVKHFNELRERPVKQMLTLEQENRILNAASPHLRVGIVLLVQTGGGTYTEGFPVALGPDRLGKPTHSIRQRRKNAGFLGAPSAHGSGISSLAQMERRIAVGFAVHLSEPAQAGTPHPKCKDGLAGDSQASKRAALSDLQLAPCFLHSTELGSTGCSDSTGHASYKPRDKAPVSTRHGRTGSRSDGESESAGVRRERSSQLGRSL